MSETRMKREGHEGLHSKYIHEGNHPSRASSRRQRAQWLQCHLINACRNHMGALSLYGSSDNIGGTIYIGLYSFLWIVFNCSHLRAAQQTLQTRAHILSLLFPLHFPALDATASVCLCLYLTPLATCVCIYVSRFLPPLVVPHCASIRPTVARAPLYWPHYRLLHCLCLSPARVHSLSLHLLLGASLPHPPTAFESLPSTTPLCVQPTESSLACAEEQWLAGCIL